jgi:hypothetical protein
MTPLVTALALSLAVPPPAYDPDSGVPPGGGYWAPGEAPVIEPPDGEDQILIGAIMLPLGTLATASASAMVWATVPGQCPRRLQGWGFNANEDQCRGLYIYNLIRLSYGSAAMVTGAVFLAIGLKRRKELERWKKRRFQSLRPTGLSFVPNRNGATMGLTLRF